MRPQDIVILLKILCYGSENWYNKDLANELFLSGAEVSNALQRSALSGLIDSDRKRVRVQTVHEFLIYGLPYVFPEQPGSITRGIPTAHSHPFMKEKFISEQQYVWADGESDERGLSVRPLYAGAVNAAKKDQKLYLMLALVDVLRMGRAREKKIAIVGLEKLMNS